MLQTLTSFLHLCLTVPLRNDTIVLGITQSSDWWWGGWTATCHFRILSFKQVFEPGTIHQLRAHEMVKKAASRSTFTRWCQTKLKEIEICATAATMDILVLVLCYAENAVCEAEIFLFAMLVVSWICSLIQLTPWTLGLAQRRMQENTAGNGGQDHYFQQHYR